LKPPGWNVLNTAATPPRDVLGQRIKEAAPDRRPEEDAGHHSDLHEVEDSDQPPSTRSLLTHRVWRFLSLVGGRVFVPLGLMRRRPRGRVLQEAPGGKILWLTRRVYSERDFSEVFVPIVSDMRTEHFGALSRGEPWWARWVLVRGYWAVCCATCSHSLWRVVRVMVSVWKAVP
jgi:hypothetical protein